MKKKISKKKAYEMFVSDFESRIKERLEHNRNNNTERIARIEVIEERKQRYNNNYANAIADKGRKSKKKRILKFFPINSPQKPILKGDGSQPRARMVRGGSPIL